MPKLEASNRATVTISRARTVCDRAANQYLRCFDGQKFRETERDWTNGCKVSERRKSRQTKEPEAPRLKGRERVCAIACCALHAYAFCFLLWREGLWALGSPTSLGGLHAPFTRVRVLLKYSSNYIFVYIYIYKVKLVVFVYYLKLSPYVSLQYHQTSWPWFGHFPCLHISVSLFFAPTSSSFLLLPKHNCNFFFLAQWLWLNKN